MNARRWLLLLMLGLLVFLAACVMTRPLPPEIVERNIFPEGTATPSGYRPGLVIVRDLFSGAGVTVTAMPGVVGSHVEIYWDDVQADLTATPNWSAVETRVAYLDSEGRDAWLSLQAYEGVYGATPSVLHLPAGVPTVSYTGSCSNTEYAPDFGSAAYRNAKATVIASMMATFGNDAKVAGFAIQPGISGEWANAYDENCNNQDSLEAAGVTCQEFLDSAIMEAAWHRDGTGKALTMATGLGACGATSHDSDRESTKYFMEKLNLTPTSGANEYIGYRYNGLSPDNSRAFFNTPTPGPWGRMQAGYVYPEYGGSYFEPGSPYGFPTQVPTADVEGYTDYMMLNAASANADNIFIQEQWYPYISSTVLDVVTQTLGLTEDDSEIAWVWFRESEYKKQNVGTGYEYNGVRGPFTHLASVVGSATPTTYCSPSVRATSIALGGSTPPDSCSTELSSPSEPESRNALGYQSGTTVGIDIQDDWQRAGNVNNTYAAKLRYLDNNSGTITVSWKNTSGLESSYEIAKGNTGAWVTTEFTMSDAAFYDGYTTHDIEIEPIDGQAVLNSLIISYTTEESTPTHTPTSTATRTPTVTRTPTKTSTPASTVTPTYTPSPTVTRTPTYTPSPTPTRTPSHTPTQTQTPTPTVTGTLSPTPTSTATFDPNSTRTPMPETPEGSRTPISEYDLTRTPMAPTPAASRTPLAYNYFVCENCNVTIYAAADCIQGAPSSDEQDFIYRASQQSRYVDRVAAGCSAPGAYLLRWSRWP